MQWSFFFLPLIFFPIQRFICMLLKDMKEGLLLKNMHRLFVKAFLMQKWGIKMWKNGVGKLREVHVRGGIEIVDKSHMVLLTGVYLRISHTHTHTHHRREIAAFHREIASWQNIHWRTFDLPHKHDTGYECCSLVFGSKFGWPYILLSLFFPWRER